VIAALRLLLLVAYALLAHLAGAQQSPMLAAFALGDLAVLVLIEPLLQRRIAAWVALAAAATALVVLARAQQTLTLLLLVPPLFTAMIGWWFARSLLAGPTRCNRGIAVTPAA
jgi:uncharacterized membrane protein